MSQQQLKFRTHKIWFGGFVVQDSVPYSTNGSVLGKGILASNRVGKMSRVQNTLNLYFMLEHEVFWDSHTVVQMLVDLMLSNICIFRFLPGIIYIPAMSYFHDWPRTIP